MQFQGTAKRKRKSSGSSDADLENSPVAENKRLKVEDSRVTDAARSVTDERLSSDLPVEHIQPYLEAEDDSDTDWLDACTDELIHTDKKFPSDVEDVVKKKIGDDAEDRSSSNTLPTTQTDKDKSKIVCLPLQSPSISVLEKIFFRSQTLLGSRVDLMNFFKRKGNTGAEDRTDELFDYNPGLQPKMRSVLLEWIVEVCDVFKMHRETYHLSVDYIDRYLCMSTNISKYQLQLIGITALLLAAKYEEIHPPKISDFAYITDGACTEKDIIKMENLMVQMLEWRCTVITSNSWLLGFFQLLYFQESQNIENDDVFLPLYNSKVYETVAHLMDLCSLDSGFLRYPYKVIALSSIYTVFEKPNSVILSASGYTYENIEDCLSWMKPFWSVLSHKFSYETIKPRILRTTGAKRSTDFAHMRVKHNIDLEILEAVHVSIEMKQSEDELEVLLTPPQSSEKRRKSVVATQKRNSEEPLV